MKQILITIAAVVLMGCGEPQHTKPSNKSLKLKDTIVNKKIHFSLNSNLNEKFWCSFNLGGVTQHSARPDATYHVEDLEIKVKDAENVRLVFNKHKMSEGDTFKAYSDSQPSGLGFTINKVEDLRPDINFKLESAVNSGDFIPKSLIPCSIPLFLMFLLFWIILRRYNRLKKIKSEWVETEAVITNIRQAEYSTPTEHGSSTHTQDVYELEYTFNQSKYKSSYGDKTDNALKRSIKGTKIGDTLNIYINPEDPQQIMVF